MGIEGYELKVASEVVNEYRLKRGRMWCGGSILQNSEIEMQLQGANYKKTRQRPPSGSNRIHDVMSITNDPWQTNPFFALTLV